MSAPRARVRVGACGFHYRHWIGVFYPEGLPADQWLRYYAERFDTVEINNTFYQLPDERTVGEWRAQAPPGFRYAVKFSRYGTHRKRLKEPEEPVARFLERVAARRIRRHLRAGRDVYAYFNIDRGGHAVQNAADLMRYCHPA